MGQRLFLCNYKLIPSHPQLYHCHITTTQSFKKVIEHPEGLHFFFAALSIFSNSSPTPLSSATSPRNVQNLSGVCEGGTWKLEQYRRASLKKGKIEEPRNISPQERFQPQDFIVLFCHQCQGHLLSCKKKLHRLKNQYLEKYTHTHTPKHSCLLETFSFLCFHSNQAPCLE